MIIYKVGFSWFLDEQEVQTYIGYYKEKKDAEGVVKISEELYKNSEKDLYKKREYFIEEIKVK